jgi:glutamate 5-kinase
LPPRESREGKEKDKLWEGPGLEVGRALVNYSSAEIARIKGVRSGEITGLLGYAESEYVALRENISFFVRESRPATPALGEER